MNRWDLNCAKISVGVRGKSTAARLHDAFFSPPLLKAKNKGGPSARGSAIDGIWDAVRSVRREISNVNYSNRASTKAHYFRETQSIRRNAATPR